MRLKLIFLTIFLSINLLAFNQSKTITIDKEQTINAETYLVDFREKGFFFFSEGVPHSVRFFDNNLNEIWEIKLNQGKFSKDEIRFHITDSGKYVYVITTEKDNSNFIKSISSDGVVSDFVKIKYSVKYSFVTGENLMVEVVKMDNSGPFEGYSRKNEPFNYLKFEPKLSFEKLKLNVPIFKYDGEKTYAHKYLEYGTSEGFYFVQRSEVSDGTEYVKLLKLDYDGNSKSLRFPFRIPTVNENNKPSKKGRSKVVRAGSSFVLAYRSFFIDEEEQKIYVFRGLRNSFSISTHNVNGGLLGINTIDLGGLPTEYKKWNAHAQMIDGDYLRVDCLFLIESDSFELYSYSVDLDGNNLIEKKIGFE